jgi:hypothetical protein
MQTMRVDMYGSVHKALRARLFDLGVELDRCDFGTPLDVAVALGVYRRTMGFIREHHGHEDRFIEPALTKCDEAIRDAVGRAHALSDVALDELDAVAAAIESDIENRPTKWRQLCSRYRAFLIEYLAHMEHEETTVHAALWAQYSDAELMELRGRLQGSIPPARFGEWLEIMLPALNLDERTAMLRGIKQAAPAPAFAAATAIASRVLGTSGWNAVREQIER